MKFAVDLHMHSCLSPCGDMDMTPNNIINMCKLKGLDMIAVTDHNTAMQLPVIQKVADYVGVSLLPGLEVTTREEAHMLAYFRTVEEAVDFSKYIYPHLPPIKNKPKLFGIQAYMNEDDEIISEEERLLITALDLSIDELFCEISGRGGIAVPAHINRGANGLLQALGFVSAELDFKALEVTKGLPLPHKGLPEVKHLHSSDAHYLENIFEREEFLELDKPTPEAFFDYILA
ncbi:MAG: PHP domain-containing protein [Clostridiales bacterium]|nr:PHP domain-containing protein [Clostridiales bacterium]